MNLLLTSMAVWLASGMACQLGADPVQEVQKGLQSREAERQIQAARKVNGLGSAAAGLVDDLAKLAADSKSDTTARQEAILALGEIGNDADSSVKSLVGIIENSEETEVLRLSAIETLRQINPMPNSVRQTLTTALENAEFQLSAALALVSIDTESRSNGRLIEIFVSTLSGPSLTAVQKREAGLGLSLCGESGLTALTKLLRSKNTDTKGVACESLGLMGADAGAAVSELVALLGDKPDVVSASALALGEIGTQGEVVVPALENLLDSNDEAVRVSAANSLGKYAGNQEFSPQLITKLAEALDDDSSSVAVEAARALERVGLPALPALGDKLESEESRALAAAIIGQIAEKADGKRKELEQIAPKLVELINANIAGENDSLLPDETTRDEVLRALGSLGPSLDKEDIVPKLHEAIGDETYKGRAVAALALAQISGKDAIPTLKKAAKDPTDQWLRTASALALVRLESDNPAIVASVLPQLLASLKDEETFVSIRENILAAISSIEQKEALPFNEREVKQVVEMLRDEDPQVRLAAIALLKKLGAKARLLRRQVILTALRLGRLDSDEKVRTAAREAVLDIE